MAIGGFTNKLLALQTMLRLCRCSAVDRLSFRLPDIDLDQQFLATILDLAPSISSVRLVNFGYKKVHAPDSRFFLEALRSLKGVREVRLPVIKPRGVRRAIVAHCQRFGIRFYWHY
ncbi:hypothetical protein AAVH_23044 [Aphelenchoides avenae]|nr:hypothetical protein AAVH_23044 [Aphelenchus avenae]